MEDLFITTILQYIFGPDALKTSWPMNNPAYIKTKIQTLHDSNKIQTFFIRFNYIKFLLIHLEKTGSIPKK